MKCPLCDGTVVNGRCKECGMPYRNDEILYHLNESRSDHYRHASDKARKIMQTQSAGVGSPGKGSAGKAAGNRNTSSGREKIRPAKTKKHSKLGILWVIIIILAAVAPLAEDLGGVIKEAIQSEVENSSEIQTDTAETTDTGTYFTAGMMSRDTRIIRSAQDMDRHRLVSSLKQENMAFLLPAPK